MIIEFKDLPALRKLYKDKNIALGSGVFDFLHYGHVLYLQSLPRYGDITVAMVKSDARVRLGKGPQRPVLPEEDRALMVDAVKGIDFTFIAPFIDFTGHKLDPMYKAVLDNLQPDIFYTTNPFWKHLESYSPKTKVVIGARELNQPKRSSTEIIEHLKELS